MTILVCLPKYNVSSLKAKIVSVYFKPIKYGIFLRNLTADKTALEWCMCTRFRISTKLLISYLSQLSELVAQH